MTFKPIYIIKAQPFSYGGALYCDFVFIDEQHDEFKNVFHVLRIKNIQAEFYMLRPAGMDLKTFIKITKSIAENNKCACSQIQYIPDSQYFSFNVKRESIKFSSTNHFDLSKCYKALKSEVIKHYSKINTQDLLPVELLMFKQTESPFRNTANAFSIDKIPVFLSTKFDIPLIGPICFDTDLSLEPITEDDTNLLNAKVDIYECDFRNISKLFTHEGANVAETYLNNLKIIAYDIETYKPPEIATWKENDTRQRIITIGFSIFNLNNPKPLRRCCIMPRDFTPEELEKYEYIKETKKFFIKYSVKDYANTDDPSYYYITKPNEESLLMRFISQINEVKPFAISGFNNWMFDDIWIHAKLEQHSLLNKMFDAINLHSFNVIRGTYITRPTFRGLNVKLDNVIRKDNYKSFTNAFTQFHDCMYAQVKEDPKRFNNRASKKLTNMLQVYHIKSPYPNSDVSDLSKSGLTYQEMFKGWAEGNRTFEIAHYCLQDAWITGVFAIRRNMIGDLIEMATITHTQFSDSLLRANNVRVGNTLTYYAYLENFLLYDTTDSNARAYQLKSPMGGKYYDKRTIIGGAVKNLKNGRERFIVAVDFSSMYPSQKEGSNIDTSSRVNDIIINNPEAFGLELVEKYYQEDMYTNRWFYVFKDKSTGQTFNVEQNFAEFKTNAKFIKEHIEEYKACSMIKNVVRRTAKLNYIIQRIKSHVYPLDLDPIDILEERVKIPPTIKVPMYFVQSPKSVKTGLPTIHYSLKEKMLSDFRAKRKAVKATVPRDATHKTQLDAKEKAIKVVMNSEYGQTGNDAFGWYDSDIGSAVTFASRHCIAECTTCLNSTHFYVDESYLNDSNVKSLIETSIKMNQLGSVKLEQIEYQPTWELALEGTQRTDDEIKEIRENTILNETSKPTFKSDYFGLLDWYLPPRRLTKSIVYEQLKQEFIKNNNIILKDGKFIKTNNNPIKPVKVWCLTLPKSVVVYQDTDSNYYTNEIITSWFKKLNPETVNEIMNVLIVHNSLLSKLIPDIINRKPIGVGFEGAFIVARYLNKKKKYYGKKWTDHVQSWIEGKRNIKTYQFNDYEKTHAIKFSNKPEINNHGEPGPIEKATIDSDSHVWIRYDWEHLPDDYEELLLTPSGDKEDNLMIYYTTIPFKDGSYLKASLKLVGEQDLLDYVHKYGIKCTGVDLARRDQYKFINFNHLLVFSNDLKYTPKDIEIDNTNEKFPLKDIIYGLLLNFAGKVEKHKINKLESAYEREYLANHKDTVHDDEIEIYYPWHLNLRQNDNPNIYSEKDYPIEYFQKIIVYDEAKQNGTREIVGRLKDQLDCTTSDVNRLVVYIKNKIFSKLTKDEQIKISEIIHETNDYLTLINKLRTLNNPLINDLVEKSKRSNLLTSLKKIVPNSGERIGFVILDQTNPEFEIKGDKDKKDKGYLLSQLRIWCNYYKDEYEYLTPEEQKTVDDSVRELLDYGYYFDKLAQSLCNYLAIEIDPTIGEYLTEDFAKAHTDLTSDDIKKQMDDKIKRVIDKIKRPLVNKYYPIRTRTSAEKILTGGKKLHKTTMIETINQNNINEIFEYNTQLIQNGIFKSIQLNLCNCTNAVELFNRIKSEPKTVYETFKNIFNKIDDYKNQIMIKAQRYSKIEISEDNYVIIKNYLSILQSVIENMDKYYRENTNIYYIWLWYEKHDDKYYYFNFAIKDSEKVKLNVKPENLIGKYQVKNRIFKNNVKTVSEYLNSYKSSIKFSKESFKIPIGCSETEISEQLEFVNFVLNIHNI